MNWVYPTIMITAITSGWIISRWTQRRMTLNPRERLAVALGAFFGGMIGAKLPFVLSDWDRFLTGYAWLDNGKTIMFGMVGGYFGVEIAKWAMQIRIKTGDSFAVPVAVAIGIGRWGCFSAGCCHGIATTLPWGVNFGDGILRHPTQIYESMFHLSFAFVLFILLRRAMFRGQLIKLYLIGYFIYRFLTEFIRPEPKLWMNLTGYQWAALAFIPLFMVLWIHDQKAQLRSEILSTRVFRADPQS